MGRNITKGTCFSGSKQKQVLFLVSLFFFLGFKLFAAVAEDHQHRHRAQEAEQADVEQQGLCGAGKEAHQHQQDADEDEDEADDGHDALKGVFHGAYLLGMMVLL